MSNYQQVGPTVVPFTSDGEFITIPVQKEYPHNFIGVVFCNAAGELVAAPAGLKAKVSGETVNTPGFYQDLAINTIDLTAPVTLSAEANLVKLRIQTQGVTAPGHLKILVTQNLA